MSLAQRSAGSPLSLLTWVRFPDWWFKVSNKIKNCNLTCFLYYTPYTYYAPYFLGYCSSGDIGIAGVCQAQGSFCSVQLFGAGAHQVQWGSEGLLQSISCKNVSCKPSYGFRNDSAAGHRQWSLRCVAGHCLVCAGSTPVLSICCDWHWIQVLRLCTCFDVGILRWSWQW